MALAGTGIALGIELAAASGGFLPPAVAAWTGVANAIVAWAPANVFPTYVLGVDSLPTTNIPQLGIQLAAGAGSVDAIGIAKWSAVAKELATWMSNKGGINQGTLLGPMGGGPVVGVGKIKFSSLAVGPKLAAAAGSPASDAIALAAWTTIGATILGHLVAFGTVLPGTMTVPNGGTPISGIGVLV